MGVLGDFLEDFFFKVGTFFSGGHFFRGGHFLKASGIFRNRGEHCSEVDTFSGIETFFQDFSRMVQHNLQNSFRNQNPENPETHTGNPENHENAAPTRFLF